MRDADERVRSSANRSHYDSLRSDFDVIMGAHFKSPAASPASSIDFQRRATGERREGDGAADAGAGRDGAERSSGSGALR